MGRRSRVQVSLDAHCLVGLARLVGLQLATQVRAVSDAMRHACHSAMSLLGSQSSFSLLHLCLQPCTTCLRLPHVAPGPTMFLTQLPDVLLEVRDVGPQLDARTPMGIECVCQLQCTALALEYLGVQQLVPIVLLLGIGLRRHKLLAQHRRRRDRRRLRRRLHGQLPPQLRNLPQPHGPACSARRGSGCRGEGLFSCRAIAISWAG
mmetsp:Transcript_66419/g.168289  ORF Transcript_66419/g.168289 Transcript_66419/m.168289 type:complete len:206 (+) Transcript_66419:1-618(+)